MLPAPCCGATALDSVCDYKADGSLVTTADGMMALLAHTEWAIANGATLDQAAVNGGQEYAATYARRLMRDRNRRAYVLAKVD